ncbi:MAG: hypothetical protein JO076_09865 [Verrucomicrobia bacterium]|nr:hypothetical protein [Verrucomicrobiota bacterium]
MKYSVQELREVLSLATPEQVAELRAISEVFNIPLDEVCAELLTLIDTHYPMPKFQFSVN